MRGAVHKHHRAYRDPPGDVGYVSVLSMWIRPSRCVARPVEGYGVGARFSFDQEQTGHETNSPAKRMSCCFDVTFNTLAWAWARETQTWLVCTSLPCFSGSEVRAVAATGVSVPHSNLEGGFQRTGCRNCLRWSFARISLCLFLAPTVPAECRVARKYDPLLLRGNVRFVPIICVSEASDTIIAVFSLYEKYVVPVHFSLPDGIFLRCDHGLDV